jgi:hypothetical protein
LFPKAIFAVADEIRRYEALSVQRYTILLGVLVAFLISVIASVVANSIANRASKAPLK